jgi:DnaJ-class molecular chaperone
MAADEEFEMESCRACRGSGKVVSNLGGEPHDEECPWCEGTGKFIPEHDAQAKWPAPEGEADAATRADTPESGA